jgi:hypothetical protein
MSRGDIISSRCVGGGGGGGGSGSDGALAFLGFTATAGNLGLGGGAGAFLDPPFVGVAPPFVGAFAGAFTGAAFGFFFGAAFVFATEATVTPTLTHPRDRLARMCVLPLKIRNGWSILWSDPEIADLG